MELLQSETPGLEAKVAFLLEPTSYPEPTLRVEAVETHMSWVFLLDRIVYKLKKPARTPFLDYSTIDLRKHFCEEEVRLNRRLAPHVYLGTVPITLERDQTMALAGSGPAIDWLVKMHRLPADHMLDYAIEHGTFTHEDIEQLAGLLMDFYRDATRVSLSPSEYRARLETDVIANRDGLRKDADQILARNTVDRAHAAQLSFLREAGRLFDQRASGGHIVEGHGDLRPEHILLGPTPQIIDRLEFNADFRTLDPVDELAYFSIECERLGAPAIGMAFFDRYRHDCADDADQQLFDFYRCYRACLRSKLAIWHLREPTIRQPGRWPGLARRYLELAAVYADRLAQPTPSDSTEGRC